MKALLINPHYPVSETPSPPLGLAFVAGALEEAGVEVALLDYVVHPYDPNALAQTLAEFKPDFAGVTCVTMNYHEAARIVGDIHRADPDLFVVMGGPHASFRAVETLKELPGLSAVAVGEGEQTAADLARRLGGDLSPVAGLVFKKNGRIIQNPARPPMTDITTLPAPARHLIPMGRYRALGLCPTMTTSRGCPFKCIFCVGRKMVGARVRYRNPRQVVDELAFLAGLGFHQINLADDLFTANPKHCLSVCKEIMDRGLKVKWTSFARVDTVTLPVLTAMKEAGCSAVSFGVESGDPAVLKIVKKGITLDQVLAAVDMCNRAGLLPHASFILGLPGETPETLKATVAFGEKLGKKGVSFGFHLLAPFPGTEVREKAAALGLEILTDDWSQYHANKAIVQTASVDCAMMNRVVDKWQAEFDTYLGELKKQREAGTADAKTTWPLTRLEHTVRIYDLMMARAMEKSGANGGDPSREPDMESLAERLSSQVSIPLAELRQTLEFAREQKYIRRAKENGRAAWKWIDYL